MYRRYCRSPSCRVRGDADARVIAAPRADDRGVHADAGQSARSVDAPEPGHRDPGVSALPRHPPVGTCGDWQGPAPGFVEADLVAHGWAVDGGQLRLDVWC